MIQLLFTVIFAEMALIMILFKTPLRKLVIMALDRVKRGRGPIVAQTVAGTYDEDPEPCCRTRFDKSHQIQ
ncbi:hypothetical protein PVL29_023424 [Vitis rotundifolia]|uniref:Uncharacterized protein n=1 Tax=Vitis rotundifolia TaxID=103349 RepID=A0AA38YNW9_VITRO|nr:hypothetical protein PVL29_023424 [Vitis rotundifolia]